ncbi:radical SAM protein [Fuerstiella marisgermanici]|uniref:Pyrroloquinoline quinone biosynthesis protein PqqE n=1 Tax=Fuerstiella marisgermanici TaxID=1891926 RepID=A0A1P8WC85_9PLAN|nr:radical SAM protein [Fuerstiella marisgermanici]APZ91656.1 pyrroloquinoline quinone biosynthesis protein PqqE [Fuerstiella marisgermanici]
MESPCQHSDYVEMTVHFRCNLKCRHCMILDSMHWLKPADDSELSALLEENRQSKQWQGLILTGAEVTLRKDLPQLAERARAAGFQHVRIQTHAMRLADMAYCETLVASGIDEYFVSVTADTAARHDLITEVPGSFDKTLQALRNLDTFPGVRLMTNTVVTRLSYQGLPEVVELLKDLRNLVQMDFWNYWPMEEEGNPELLVSHFDVRPYLKQAILLARKYGRHVEVKNFPHCLMGETSSALKNDQPELRIDPKFWDEFNRNGFEQCAYRDICGSTQCLGLNTAYVNHFGWHEDRLSPMPRSA